MPPSAMRSSLQAENMSPAAEVQSPIFRPLLGSVLIDRTGQTYSTGVLDDKIVGLYFSAQWCPSCRYFTPSLVSFYKAMQEMDNPFEVVFVSSDRNARDMQIHMDETSMPWLALPFSERGLQQILQRRYFLPGIPSLIILDSRGEILSTAGITDVMQRGAKAYEQWR